MVWNVSADEIIKRWVGETPDTDDALLISLISDSVVLLNKKAPSIDKRLNPEPINGVPQEPEKDLQTVVNMTVAKMVQRAYHSDYSSYLSVSNAVGPQSASYSKGADGKQGLYILPEELSLLDEDAVDKRSRIGVLRNPANPNFYARDSYYGRWDGYGYGSR